MIGRKGGWLNVSMIQFEMRNVAYLSLLLFFMLFLWQRVESESAAVCR